MTDATAADILALKPAQARTLFPGDPAAVAARFKALAKVWHPDTNPHADPSVFAHVVMLHGVAKAAHGSKPGGERILASTDGRRFRVAYQVRHATDLGETLVGRSRIVHVVPRDLGDLAARAARLTPRFADDGMREEFSRFLPRRLEEFETADAFVFVESKTPDQVMLRDLLALAPFDPRHAAWMATRLVNIACWLEWAGFAHGAIGPDTLLVSPEFHSVALTGPFLSSRGFGSPLSALPGRTLDCCPRYGVAGAVADRRLDPELVRLTLRECLGDPAGTRLASDPDFPKPFADWLLLPAAKGARADFAAWENARDASFGARRFVKWDVDPAALMAA